MKLRAFSSFLVIPLSISCALLGLGPKPNDGTQTQNGWKQAAAAHLPGETPKAGNVSLAIGNQRAQAAYGKLPMFFESNAGQTDPAVKFLSRGGGYNLFLTATEAVVVARHADTSAAVRMKLEGANPSPRIVGVEKLAGKTNYFIGNDPAKWRTNVPTFGKVKYAGVYPGIDLLYYGTREKLEYDFVVAPGRDPEKIRIRVSGAQESNVNAAGDLVLTTAAGDVKLAKPVIYQEAKGERREIAGRFKLTGGNLLGFRVGSYDKSLPLVIDPTLAYSTYLGGSGATGDVASGIAVDAAGEAFITGATTSNDFPTVTGSLKTTQPGIRNAFVTKFAANGASLVYSTYLGGSNTDEGNAIALDAAGDAWITGATSSNNFPVTNTTTLTSTQNVFVTKLAANGASLLFSTYLGGNAQDIGNGIAVDGSGNAYVTGGTASSNFPVTAGVLQGTLAGFSNAFVAKFSAAGAVSFSTYLGGNNTDAGIAVAVDTAGNVYVTGDTNSTNFPLKNPFQSSLGAATVTNPFVTTLNSSGTALVYSTYLGGSSNDHVGGIALDASANAVVVGAATSMDFPVLNSLQGHDPFVDDLFAAKFAPTGSLIFSSLFGDSSGETEANAVALDSSGNIYVTGFTSALFLPTLNPLQATTTAGFFLTSTNQAAFVTELKSDASDYFFSTFLGGSELPAGSTSAFGDTGFAIAVDSSANIYVAGSAQTVDFPVDAFQPTLKSMTGDGFVSKIAPATPVGPQVFPTSLNLGTTPVGSTTPAQIVTISNGTGTLTFTSITIVGANPGDFKEDDSCGPALLPHVVCTLDITATPTTTGTRTATLQIADSATGSPQTVALTAVGGPAPPPPPTGTLMISPAGPLMFASQEVTTSSATQTITVTNTGATVTVSFTFLFQGVNPFDFFDAFTGTCPGFSGTLTPGSSCTINVGFRPTATGVRNAALQFNGNFTGSPVSVALTGTGTPRIAVLSPTSVNFGNQVVATTSAPMTFTLTNTSSTVTVTAKAPATTIGVVLSPPSTPNFAISANTCGASLAPMATCTISVTFKPTTTGFAFASLIVTDSDPASQSASMFGQGLNAAATLATIFPTSLDFARQNLGSTSSARFVFLSNVGNTALVFTVMPGGANPTEFAETDSCSGSIPAGGNCSLMVTFTPGAVGFRTAILTINSTTMSVTGVPQTVTVTGTGVTATTAAFTPTSLVFPNTATGVPSAPLLVTFANTGNRPLVVSGGGLSGTNPTDFSFSPVSNGVSTIGCPSGSSFLFLATRYNPQVACPISFVFTPGPTGGPTRTATFTIMDSASNSPQTVTLMGTTGSGAGAVLSTTTLSFGNQGVGIPSSVMSVTVSNPGTVALSISTVAVSGPNKNDFAISSGTTCTNGSTVAVTMSCVVNIIFTPSTAAGESATLTFTDNASPTTQTVTLTGNGISVPGVSISGISPFAAQPIGVKSAPQAVTIRVTAGTGTLFLSSITITGTNSTDFGETDNCLPSVAGGASCTINVTFTPSLVGGETATLMIAGINLAGTPVSITLTGTGVAAGPIVSLAGSVSFGTVATGTTATMMATLTNTGSTSLAFATSGAFVLTGATSFGQSNNCPASLAAGASCTITFTYTPSPSAISETATLTVTDNATPPTQTVSLSGTGAVVTATLSPLTVAFGSVTQGIKSAPMSVFLSASVNIGLNITSIGFSGTNAADFSETDNCGKMVSADSSCTIMVFFTPSLGAMTTESAMLVVTDNAAASPTQTVTLTGIGLTPTTSFTFTAAPGAGTSVSIVPGDTGRFKLVLNPSASSSGSVMFTCLNSTASVAFTLCTPTPGTATLTGSTPIPLQVDFQTNCHPSLVPPRGPAGRPHLPPVVVTLWLAALLALAATRRLAPQWRLARVVPALALLLLAMTWASCGGASLPPGDPPLFPGQPNTPPGLYTITVTATSGAVTSSINLTVRVM